MKFWLSGLFTCNKDMGRLFSEYSAQRSDFEDFFTSEPWWQPSSSSPSWCSSSIPEKCHEIKFPTFTSDDIVMAEAISSIFTTSSSSHQSPAEVVGSNSGFKPYTSAVLPDSVLNKKLYCGQKMIKGAVDILRKINMMKDEASNQEPASSRTQLHHVISERKRREKLNESFYGLRQLLPPCSKRDKVSVLGRTKYYIKTLEAQIFDLEKSNQMLEMHPDEAKDVSGTINSIDLQIVEAFEPVIGIRRINFKITVRVECDLLEVVLHALEYLKEISAISLISIDANTAYSKKMIMLTCLKLLFDIKATDWDEVSFKAGIFTAVDSATMSL